MMLLSVHPNKWLVRGSLSFVVDMDS
jgi:hypothetical protein